MAGENGGTRPRAPTITVDTSAIDQTPGGQSEARGGDQNPNALAVPNNQRPRGDSNASNSSRSTVGSDTLASPSGAHAPITYPTDIDDEDALWKPESAEESAAFDIDKGPFGLTPGHLAKLIPRKNLSVLYTLRGLPGLVKALRTDLSAGLSVDEDRLDGTVSLDEVKSASSDISEKPSASGGDGGKADEAVTSDGFSDRKRVFGDNRLPERKSKTILQLAWIAFQDKILILLTVAAIISLAVGIYQAARPHTPKTPKPGEEEQVGGANVEYVEGLAILLAVIVVVFVGAINDWKKERQFAKLNRKKEDRLVKVIRSGKTVKVSVYDILVGDIMILEQGDVLPVDGIYIEGHGVSCDESSATGESDLIKKTPALVVMKTLENHEELKKMDPFIISGAKVSEGFGTFLVTAVGVHSSFGKTMMSLREENEVTPLQYKLNKLAGYIAKLGSGAGALLLIVLTIRFLADLKNNTGNADEKGQEYLTIFITAVTIIVVAVPEGLPLAVTLALAYATKRMTRDNNLVRHLQSCETMGNATVVCSDKTGTLTQNVMTVVAATIGTGTLRAGDQSKLPSKPADADDNRSNASTPEPAPGTSDKGLPSDKKTESADVTKAPVTKDGIDDIKAPAASGDHVNISFGELKDHLPTDMQTVFRSLIANNSTAFEGEEKGKPVFLGSKTETALLDFAQRYFGLTNLAEERSNTNVAQLFPFDSAKKCMGVVVKLASSDGSAKYRLYIKGAPEIILGNCHSVLKSHKSEETIPLSSADRTNLEHYIGSYADLSLRTIALAYRDFTEWPPKGIKPSAENPNMVEFKDVFGELTWLAVVGIQDPVRPGVPEAVLQCQRAGVKIIMVTGDNVQTARAIAKECGILKEGGLVMEGPQFRALNQFELREKVPQLCVLARSSPDDKKTLVGALQTAGHVVAVTGDGTNDAPALKAADVGFSMGITGTEVAKEASDIILMDDNFSSIVKALAWGRTINDAVKKFLQFQITVNITAVLLTFITAVASPDETSVLKAIQLLWVNLIMDTMAALALATDPPPDSVFDRKPEPRNVSLITTTMWKMIILQSIFQLVVTLILHFAGPKFLSGSSYRDVGKMQTLVFNTFVWMQIFNAINSRRIDNKLNIFEGFFKNRLFVGIFLAMVAGQALIVQFGTYVFAVEPITGGQWGISIVIGFLSIPFGAVIRIIPDKWFIWVVHHLIPKVVRDFFSSERKRDKDGVPREPEEEFRDEWNRALFQIKSDLTQYQRVRGGRLRLLRQSIKNPKTILSRSRSGSRLTGSPMHSALGMPGLVAGSIGGLSPVDRRSINPEADGQDIGIPPAAAPATAPVAATDVSDSKRRGDDLV